MVMVDGRISISGNGVVDTRFVGVAGRLGELRIEGIERLARLRIEGSESIPALDGDFGMWRMGGSAFNTEDGRTAREISPSSPAQLSLNISGTSLRRLPSETRMLVGRNAGYGDVLLIKVDPEKDVPVFLFVGVFPSPASDTEGMGMCRYQFLFGGAWSKSSSASICLPGNIKWSSFI